MRGTTVAKATDRPAASWLVVAYGVLASRIWSAGMSAKPVVL
jgi:hypothetical protein